MTEEERDVRDCKIELLWLDGMKPSAIATQVRLKADRVRQVLKAKGYRVNFRKPQEPSHSVWEMSDMARKRKFWERARKAAAEARTQEAA
ncbi:MAG: hypothetical protein JWM16_6325 [Verrucomicrobiales bacterium]|nr:hypothetical protein [Verrucomicrobiales bacterium]